MKRPPAEPEKPVRLSLAPEDHRRLRVLAAEQGQSMAQHVRQLVERYVRDSPKGASK